jgi:MORN repeat variant
MMKKQHYFIAGLLGLIPALAQAQTEAGKTTLPVIHESKQAWQYSKPVEYYSAGGTRIYNPKYAKFHSQTTMHDSVSGTERVYYASGKLFLVIAYARVDTRLQQGITSTWSENGRLKSEVEFYAGKRHGIYRVYFPNGKIEQEATFAHGVWQRGNRFTRGGKALPFYASDPTRSESSNGAPGSTELISQSHPAPMPEPPQSTNTFIPQSQPQMRGDVIQPASPGSYGRW